MRSVFGWSLPPGAANDPFAPYNQEEDPCEVCGNYVDDCICPECPVCHNAGDPKCYEEHGLVRNQDQIDGRKKLDDLWEERNRREGEMFYE